MAKVDAALADLERQHAALKAEYVATHMKWLTEPDAYAKAVYQETLTEILQRSWYLTFKMMALESGNDGA